MEIRPKYQVFKIVTEKPLLRGAILDPIFSMGKSKNLTYWRSNVSL